MNKVKMEIGSEFWLENKGNRKEKKYKNLESNISFLFSGRSAIDYVLEHIMKTKKIKNVYFPSYCCNSMLQPFIDRKIKIEFYQVYYENGLKYKIDLNKKCDIFFAMNYFGYSSTNMDYYIKKYKENSNTIVIEDITHSLLNNRKMCSKSDYAIASLRKWFPVISGGVAINLNGKFENQISLKEPNNDIISIKREAMQNKRDYINGKTQNKEEFLKKYSVFNKSLSDDYKKIRIDEESLKYLEYLNANKIRNARIRNAKVIKNKLKENEKVEFLAAEEGDCPLFVPILLSDEKIRNKLKDYLIKNKVYLPVHWEQPDVVIEECNIYNRELSLVCDQRYSKKDIEEYIEKIKQFLEEEN